MKDWIIGHPKCFEVERNMRITGSMRGVAEALSRCVQTVIGESLFNLIVWNCDAVRRNDLGGEWGRPLARLDDSQISNLVHVQRIPNNVTFVSSMLVFLTRRGT